MLSEVDVMLDGLDFSQVALQHSFKFGEDVGNFPTSIGKLVRAITDLAKVVC